MKLSLSILIPCYNVESTVEGVIKDANAVGKKVGSSLELIATNDGSIDQTGAILNRLKKTIPSLHIITHTVNQGYGKTIKELYLAGKNTWLFTFPGDNQFSGSELLKLIPYTHLADLILGLRSHRNDPPMRRFQSRFYNTLLRTFFHLPTRDVNTIRLMKRSLIQHLPIQSDTAFIDAELAIRAKRSGYRIIEIPVIHKKRTSRGATGGNFFRTILPTIIDMVKLYLLK